MNLYEQAEKFFHACDSEADWEACKEYVANDDAPFVAQSAPLADVKTIKDYVNWNKGFATISPDGNYAVNASCYDEANKTAMFFATYTGSHSGEGGPVPPTNKKTESHYVYAIKMNDEGKVVHMTKIWNASWAMRDLGWM